MALTSTSFGELLDRVRLRGAIALAALGNAAPPRKVDPAKVALAVYIISSNPILSISNRKKKCLHNRP
jgi:hypothetical protein